MAGRARPQAKSLISYEVPGVARAVHFASPTARRFGPPSRMEATMQREPLDENLLDELTRLVGRPSTVLRDVLERTIGVLIEALTPDTARELSTFPMTAWQSLAPHAPVTRALWSAVLSAGLTAEETFTALAVIDDHVRRRYGVMGWATLAEWGPGLAGRYRLDAMPRASDRLRDGFAL